MKQTPHTTIRDSITRMSALMPSVATVDTTLKLVAALWSALRTVGMMALHHLPRTHSAVAYETCWLDLLFDMKDAHGERVVLTRRQRVRLVQPGQLTVRELVWGDGEPGLTGYQARGAHRIGERFEGSKRAVLLDSDGPVAAGQCLTITTRRTLRQAFRSAEEYCEAFLERPTGWLRITARFPVRRPPRRARLVLAATEQVLRSVPVRRDPAGRPLLQCRVRQPAIGVVYSLRWAW